MGTNYYLHSQEQPPCPCCQGPYEAERLHIGKSAAGWCFALHVVPETGINDLEDWRRAWVAPGKVIRDEYGTLVEPARMLEIICDRTWRPTPRNRAWYDVNHALPGPTGLARARIDGVHCIGHGAGTWDLIAGEFS